MGIGGRLRQAYIASKMLGLAGKAGSGVKSGINSAREIGGSVANRFINRKEYIQRERAKQERAQYERQSFEQRNAEKIEKENIKREQKRIFEQMLDSLGIHGYLARLRAKRNKKLLGMVRVIHSIFGNKLNSGEINAINKILQRNLHPKSEILRKSPELNKAIDIIGKGNPKNKVELAFNVLSQASMDIIKKDEMGQQIMQSKGLM